MTHDTGKDEAAAETDWLRRELQDDFDEELEQEIDDSRLPAELRELLGRRVASTVDRGVYFRELLRLQAELVKLQDWVMHRGLKLVVLFEGRDSAGKGGVIKRITQRVNPRTCRVAGDGLRRRAAGGGFLPRRAGVRTDAGAVRHHPGEILVLDHRRGAAAALPDAHP
jgi:hypothetical protein